MKSPTRPHAHTLSRLLWLLVWVLLAIYLALTLWLGFAGLVYPYQLDYGEGIVLWFAQQMAGGHSIYKGLTGLPYASSNYPPAAMLLSALLMPIFGQGYVSGRLLNFAAALIVAALIYRVVRAETGARSLGALAALFFIGSPYVYHWVPLFRVDLLGLAFAFGGIYVVWTWERRQQTIYFLLFTFCFLLALYTKQTLFAAPAAAFLTLWPRDRRLAIAFALALGGVGGGIYLAMDAATGGAFTFGLITSNATFFLPEQLFNLLTNFAVTFPILLMFAAWGLINRFKARQVGVLEWYVVISFAGLLMAGRTGAWENYFFEALAAVCVMAVRSWKLEVRSWKSNSPTTDFELRTLNFQLVLPLLLLLQIILMWHDPRIAANLIAEDTAADQQLAELLARTPGTIISEDMGALASSGKNVDYYTFQYSSLARSGQWDQNWELNGLRDGAFPLVILERGTREDVDHYRRFTREFVSALDRYYARVQTLGKYEVYAPAPLQHLQSAEFGDELATVGWSIEPITFQPSRMRVMIVWQAKRVMARRYTAFVHLDEAGKKIAQDDHEPRWGRYPTTRWSAGEMVREEYTLNLSGDMAQGKYVLRVGWYDTETGDRLEVPGSADNAVVLMTFQK